MPAVAASGQNTFRPSAPYAIGCIGEGGGDVGMGSDGGSEGGGDGGGGDGGGGDGGEQNAKSSEHPMHAAEAPGGLRQFTFHVFQPMLPQNLRLVCMYHMGM
jgi:hypothetical protein